MIRHRLLLSFAIAVGVSSGLFAQIDVPSGAPLTLLEMPLQYKDWPQQRSVYTLLELDVVREILLVFSEDDGQYIIVRHPGGDAGNAWALELREWLVALGVPSHFITLEPGSGGADRLLILVEAKPAALNSSV